MSLRREEWFDFGYVSDFSDDLYEHYFQDIEGPKTMYYPYIFCFDLPRDIDIEQYPEVQKVLVLRFVGYTAGAIYVDGERKVLGAKLYQRTTNRFPVPIEDVEKYINEKWKGEVIR